MRGLAAVQHSIIALLQDRTWSYLSPEDCRNLVDAGYPFTR